MKFFLNLLFCACAYSAVSQINLDSGLLACYALNGNAFEPINNLHGILNGQTAATNRFNKSDACLNMNSGYIELPASTLLKPGLLSFSAWIRASGSGSILYTETTNGYPAYSLSYEDMVTLKSFRLKKTNSNSLTVSLDNTSPLSFNTWYHVTITIDYNYLKIYVNGVLENTLNANINFGYGSGKKVYIGRAFNGKLDNVRFYNRVLSATEVSQLYSGDPECITSTLAPVSSFSVSRACVNQPVQFTDLTPNNPSSWNWKISGVYGSSLDVNPQYTFTSTGVYSATLITSNSLGSNTTSSTFTVYPKPLVNATASPTLICDNDETTLSAFGASTYAWSSSHTGSTVKIRPYFSRTYTVTGTDTNGCYSNATVLVKVMIHCYMSVKENTNDLKDIFVYPNPTVEI